MNNQSGKGSKNRLRGESLTAYGKSKLWENIGKDKKIQKALSDLCKHSNNHNEQDRQKVEQGGKDENSRL